MCIRDRVATMNVKNRKCIRKLSLKSLYANRRRNLIAIFAIALTTMLFTSMFTIVLSLNASYETYQFRQVGGYAHGTFKDVSPEQAERIAAHPKVKAAGARKVIGITVDGVFSKTPAEISYMDANCTKWSSVSYTHLGFRSWQWKSCRIISTCLWIAGRSFIFQI